ncbi:hypothetical protein HDU77_004689 [Chytriomyces hyalinus]|nr:hypothetical protein HDU77_004689 [Chytriomyces hyalinus]
MKVKTTTTTSSCLGEHFISIHTLRFIFSLYNGHEEVQTYDEISFSIAFGPGLGSTDGTDEGRDEDEVPDDAPDDDDYERPNFGKDFPGQEINFLNPTNDTLEYRRPYTIDPHKPARVTASVNGWGGAASSSNSAKKPRFDSNEQTSLRSAISEVLDGMPDEPAAYVLVDFGNGGCGRRIACLSHLRLQTDLATESSPPMRNNYRDVNA